MWLPAVAMHRLGIAEIAPSHHRCFRTVNPCSKSVNCSPAEPVLSRSSRQRLGHLQFHFDRGWHVCQAVFPELQPAAACRRVERRDGAHEALPRLQSACSWLVMGLTVEACTSRALPDSKSAILLPPSHKSKKMLPRKRDTSQSHTKGPFSGPALTIMSFNVEGLSAANYPMEVGEWVLR